MKNRNRVNRQNQRGFTLLEVLLATTLLALIMALAWAGLRAGGQVAERGSAAIEASNHLRASQRFIRLQLRRMLPLAMETDEDNKPVLFIGEPDRMQFVADMPGYLGQGGPQAQEIYLDRAPDGSRALLFNFHPLHLLDDDAEPPQGEPVMLFSGIRRARFEYRGLDEEGELGDWEDQWEDPTLLPVMVAIRLEPSDEHLRWPDIEAVPLLDTAAGRRVVRPMIMGTTKP